MEEFGINAEGNYLAVIGDLRASKRLSHREQWQAALADCLEELNRQLAPEIAARFLVTIGDEFQGLLEGASSLIPFLVAVEIRLPALSIRYGAGWGCLSTSLKAEALGMDGPCFHRARAALSRSKKADRWVSLAGFGDDEDETLNAIFALLGAHRRRWTATQAETVALMRQLDTRKAVAEARGVSPSTVTEALHAALYEPVVETERAVARLLHAFSKPSFLVHETRKRDCRS